MSTPLARCSLRCRFAMRRFCWPENLRLVVQLAGPYQEHGPDTAVQHAPRNAAEDDSPETRGCALCSRYAASSSSLRSIACVLVSAYLGAALAKRAAGADRLTKINGCTVSSGSSIVAEGTPP